MAHSVLTIDETLACLAESPRRIGELTRGLTPARLRQAPGPDEWSANDVLAHLRCCADVWGGYLARILDEENPKIRAMSPRGWINKTNYRELAFEVSLRAFGAQRDGLLERLRLLSPTAWSRTGRVTRSGKQLAETVRSYAERLAEHERHHLDQFRRIASVLGS